jgi:crossover junction endodeoxyribonuclease RuvC
LLRYNGRMKVLGIDPGYGRCGMAIVERQAGKDALLFSDCVETGAEEEFTVRLSTIVKRCAQLIETHSPNALSIEKLFFNANQKTAMRVAEVRGAIIMCASERGVDVFEYAPAQIKSAIASSGAADKKQIATMLHLLVKIDKEIRRDDEYDAIAIALAHLAMARSAQMV